MQTQKVGPIESTGYTRPEPPPVVKKEEGPKRSASAGTEVAFGVMKEAEADSEASKQNPESQARIRDDARKAYQQALKLDPNHLDAHRCLGRLYVKMGDYDRAQEIYKKAMAKHPKDAGLWYDLGQCHNRRKHFTESIRCFAKAIELDPENRDYCSKLGYTLAWMGSIDQGVTYLARAHGVGMAHFKVACLLDQKDQREAALQHCRLARRENGELLEEARELLAALEGTSAAPPLRRGTLAAPIAVH